MRPRKGEAGSRCSRSQKAEGIFFEASLRGSGVETSGRSSVMSPRGSGVVLFTRRNWSRWSATSSAMNAFTGTGQSERFDCMSAIGRCWPSTIQPGFSSPSRGKGIVSRPTTHVGVVARALGPERHMRRQGDDERVRK